MTKLPLSGIELATQWSEAQHATAGLRRPPGPGGFQYLPSRAFGAVGDNKPDIGLSKVIKYLFYTLHATQKMITKNKRLVE